MEHHIQTRVLLRQRPHYLRGQDQELAVLLRNDIGRACHARQRCDLSEKLALAHISQEDILLTSHEPCSDTTLQDEISRITCLTAIRYHSARRRFRNQRIRRQLCPFFGTHSRQLRQMTDKTLHFRQGGWSTHPKPGRRLDSSQEVKRALPLGA